MFRHINVLAECQLKVSRYGETPQPSSSFETRGALVQTASRAEKPEATESQMVCRD
jgi:hypothetical protein